MSRVSALYHIVFSTKMREDTIPLLYERDLYGVIWSIIKKHNGSRLLRIGGISNHIHILLDIHPSCSLAEMVRDIKSISSGWMKSDPRFFSFKGWEREYFAASVSARDKDAVISYINNQKTHHNTRCYVDEIQTMCVEELLQPYYFADKQ